MLLEQKKQIQSLITSVNTYSHLFKGIDLKKEIQSINTSLYYDDKYNTEKTLNEIVYSDGSVMLFNTYEELYSYIKGMSDFVDMIVATDSKYDL